MEMKEAGADGDIWVERQTPPLGKERRQENNEAFYSLI